MSGEHASKGSSSSSSSSIDPSSGSWAGNVSRLLRETIGAYCAPDIAATIVQAALAQAGHVTPPEAPAALATFVREHLAPQVEGRLGEDVAAELQGRFVRLLDVVDRTTPTGPPPMDHEALAAAARKIVPSASLIELQPLEDHREDPTQPTPADGIERLTRAAREDSTMEMPHELAARLGTAARGVLRPREPGAPLAVGILTSDPRLVALARVARRDGGTTVGFQSLAELARVERGTLDVVIVDRHRADRDEPPSVPRALAGVHVVLWPASRALAAELDTSRPDLAGASAYDDLLGIDEVIERVAIALGVR